MIVALATAGATAALAGALSPQAVAAVAGTANPSAYGCTGGFFCVYSGTNGSGSKCQVANTNGDIAALPGCSWVANANARSVYNDSGRSATYYTSTHYANRIGSTASGGSGNLQGTYRIRSVKLS